MHNLKPKRPHTDTHTERDVYAPLRGIASGDARQLDWSRPSSGLAIAERERERERERESFVDDDGGNAMAKRK